VRLVFILDNTVVALPMSSLSRRWSRASRLILPTGLHCEPAAPYGGAPGILDLRGCGRTGVFGPFVGRSAWQKTAVLARARHLSAAEGGFGCAVNVLFRWSRKTDCRLGKCPLVPFIYNASCAGKLFVL
jgi:hypothetical protein